MNPVKTDYASQNLATGSLTHTFTVDVESLLLYQIYLHFSGNVSQAVLIVVKSIVDTTNRVYELASSTLSSADDYVYEPSQPKLLRKGDIIVITCANSGTPAITAYSEIRMTEKEY